MSPFTKKRGVLGTPLRAPLSKSSVTLASWTRSRSSASKRAASSTPTASACARSSCVGELVLVLEEPVVHLPEAALGGGGLGRLGGERRPRVKVRQGHVAEDEAELVAEALEQLVHDGVGLAAVRALEIAVLDERDGGVRATAHVVALGGHGRAERGDLRLHISTLLIATDAAPGPAAICRPQRRRMPSATDRYGARVVHCRVPRQARWGNGGTSGPDIWAGANAV